MTPFNVVSRRSTPEIVLKRNIFFLQNSEIKMANCIIVDIVKSLY